MARLLQVEGELFIRNRGCTVMQFFFERVGVKKSNLSIIQIYSRKYVSRWNYRSLFYY